MSPFTHSACFYHQVYAGKTIVAFKSKSAGIVYIMIYFSGYVFSFMRWPSFLSPIYFDSKLELYFIGSVIGSFIIWRNECSTFKSNWNYLYVLIELF